MITPRLVGNWGNRQRNIDETAVLAMTDCVVMLDLLAPADAIKDRGFFIMALLWNEDGDRLADHFLRPVPEKLLSALVPTLDDAVEILAEDRVPRGFDDCRELRGSFIGSAIAFGIALGLQPQRRILECKRRQ
jgi:hypothetical protein